MSDGDRTAIGGRLAGLDHAVTVGTRDAEATLARGDDFATWAAELAVAFWIRAGMSVGHDHCDFKIARESSGPVSGAVRYADPGPMCGHGNGARVPQRLRAVNRLSVAAVSGPRSVGRRNQSRLASVSAMPASGQPAW